MSLMNKNIVLYQQNKCCCSQYHCYTKSSSFKKQQTKLIHYFCHKYLQKKSWKKNITPKQSRNTQLWTNLLFDGAGSSQLVTRNSQTDFAVITLQVRRYHVVSLPLPLPPSVTEHRLQFRRAWKLIPLHNQNFRERRPPVALCRYIFIFTSSLRNVLVELSFF